VSLDEDPHASAETKGEMEHRLLLDVIVEEGPTVFELLRLAGENKSLLVGGNALPVRVLTICIPPRRRQYRVACVGVWRPITHDSVGSTGIVEVTC